MKYYLHLARENEIPSRIKFLYTAFHQYFILMGTEDGFAILRSFPLVDDGISFILGHFYEVQRLLNSEKVSDSVIVLNTCYPNVFKSYLNTFGKVYFCKTLEDGSACFRSKDDFPMGFDILDSELLLLYENDPRPLTKIRSAYEELRRGKYVR